MSRVVHRAGGTAAHAACGVFLPVGAPLVASVEAEVTCRRCLGSLRRPRGHRHRWSAPYEAATGRARRCLACDHREMLP